MLMVAVRMSGTVRRPGQIRSPGGNFLTSLVPPPPPPCPPCASRRPVEAGVGPEAEVQAEVEGVAVHKFF